MNMGFDNVVLMFVLQPVMSVFMGSWVPGLPLRGIPE
jgi:hypothetical protein